ncbi:beta-N-acetylhexosaminidase [Thalassotalea agarivorans]|uniref:beta-N-acetylhexosaminidase n=1 Tax=Thalassotalea agarivorans TaxID=349064 RepID=A0A1I0DR97_THASX|nr:family 20 glycosylhydrolase [Thalassotalea agarivorans]SET34270.1 hexosaminidase [Thalassotalea agarivorans]
MLRVVTHLTLFLSCLTLLTACSQQDTQNEAKQVDKAIHVMPLPVSVMKQEGTLALANISTIYVADEQLTDIATQVSDIVTPLTNQPLNIKKSSASSLSDLAGALVLSIDSDLSGGVEAYKLSANSQGVVIVGGSAKGVYWGVQTFKQLFLEHTSFHSDAPLKQGSNVMLPAVSISDHPRFAHRGFMLDVSRQFFTVEEVKQVIDYLAMYKFNVLHLHLTDDQGWRIDIPSWPKLTEIGSNAAVGQTSCKNCFYTLEDYEELVHYADSRFVTIIPEIDVPGHVRAAQASYPDELYCDGDAPEWPYTGIKVKISSLCFKNEATYQFFDDVVKAVAARTTGDFIHIGGDETPDWVAHEDYTTFMLRAEQIVNSHGKTMIGWTDDLGSVHGLSANTLGQHWTTETSCCETTLNMASRGSRIIMSHANKAYLDIKYDENETLGQDWAGLNSIQNSYQWDPQAIIPGLNPDAVYGVEAALWTETIDSMSDAQYMMFPRLIGLAEVAWTQQSQRDWQSYVERLDAQLNFLSRQGINFKAP